MALGDRGNNRSGDYSSYVFTVGTVALALGVSTAMISTLTSGAAIGGILAGGINLFSQWALGAEMPDIKSLVTSTVFGGITGALSVGASIFPRGRKLQFSLEHKWL